MFLDMGNTQSSVLGPMLFSIYAAPLISIIKLFGVVNHLYVDDMQLYLSFKIKNADAAKFTIEDCLQHVKKWMTENMLKLNEDTTEFY